jgi:hypothetical protein
MRSQAARVARGAPLDSPNPSHRLDYPSQPMTESFPPEIYDREYFLSEQCEGFEGREVADEPA